jgi:hypothetical protein
VEEEEEMNDERWKGLLYAEFEDTYFTRQFIDDALNCAGNATIRDSSLVGVASRLAKRLSAAEQKVEYFEALNRGRNHSLGQQLEKECSSLRIENAGLKQEVASWDKMCAELHVEIQSLKKLKGIR